MDNLTIFLIIFFIIILIILIIAILYNFTISPLPPTLTLALQDTIDTKFISGEFTINNNKKDFLFDISTLNLQESLYISTIDTGLQFLKKGYYNFQINFTITNQNNTGNDFNVDIFFSSVSSKILQYGYNQVAGNVYGPQYLYFRQTSYCDGNNANTGFERYYQKGEEDLGGYLSPLIVGFYPCKASNNGGTHSNYYTFSGSINITDPSTIYYLQFAFNLGGSTMSGHGNIYLQYLE